MATTLFFTSPSDVIQCGTAHLGWGGGSAPYTVTVLDGQVATGGAALAVVGSGLIGFADTWQVVAPANKLLVFQVSDGQQNTARTNVVAVQPSSDESCLPANERTGSLTSLPTSPTSTPGTATSTNSTSITSTTTTSTSTTITSAILTPPPSPPSFPISSAPPLPTITPPPTKSSPSLGMIVGGAVAAAIVLAAIVGFCIWRRRARQAEEDDQIFAVTQPMNADEYPPRPGQDAWNPRTRPAIALNDMAHQSSHSLASSMGRVTAVPPMPPMEYYGNADMHYPPHPPPQRMPSHDALGTHGPPPGRPNLAVYPVPSSTGRPGSTITTPVELMAPGMDYQDPRMPGHPGFADNRISTYNPLQFGDPRQQQQQHPGGYTRAPTQPPIDYYNADPKRVLRAAQAAREGAATSASQDGSSGSGSSPQSTHPPPSDTLPRDLTPAEMAALADMVASRIGRPAPGPPQPEFDEPPPKYE